MRLVPEFVPHFAVHFDFFFWPVARRKCKVSKSMGHTEGSVHSHKYTIQTILCQVLFENYFDEPLRHEDTKGYGIFNPRISPISAIFANFRWGRNEGRGIRDKWREKQATLCSDGRGCEQA
jgi:hypothetical protein